MLTEIALPVEGTNLLVKTYLHESQPDTTVSLQESLYLSKKTFNLKYNNNFCIYHNSFKEEVNFCIDFRSIYQIHQTRLIEAHSVSPLYAQRSIVPELADLSLTFTQLLTRHQRTLNSTEDNIGKLKKEFEAEYLKYHSYLSVPKQTAVEIFDKIAQCISELNFKSAKVELTNSNTVKFILTFPDKKLLMISKSFDPSEVDFDEDEIFFSFSVNRNLIASNTAKIELFIEGFKKFLSI